MMIKWNPRQETIHWPKRGKIWKYQPKPKTHRDYLKRKGKEKKEKASIWYSSVRGEMKKLFRQWSEAKKKLM